MTTPLDSMFPHSGLLNAFLDPCIYSYSALSTFLLFSSTHQHRPGPSVGHKHVRGVQLYGAERLMT